MVFTGCQVLLTGGFEAKILAEKRHYVILETISHSARVRALVNLKAVRNSIRIQNVVKFGGVGLQTILVAHVNRNCSILAQVSDVLINESQRRIGRELGDNVGLGFAILDRQIEIKRWILWIGCPGRRTGKLRTKEERGLLLVCRSLDCSERLFEIRHLTAGTSRCSVALSAGHRRKAAGAHDVEASENVGMLHADARCSVSTHRMAHQPTR